MFGQRQGTDAVAGTKQNRKKRKRRVRDSSLTGIELITDEEWTRTVHNMEADRSIETQLFNRSIEADRFMGDSMCQTTNGESFRSYFASNNREKENHLASTQNWRKLLLMVNEGHDAPLVISEEIFKENINVLLNGIDECARNPALWSREDTNFYFSKIQGFVDSWKRQLLKEKEKIDEEVWLLKGKLENKRDLVTNRLSILTGVFDESLAFIKFSEFQKKVIQTKVQELNDVRSRFSESEQLVLSESSFATELENRDHQLIKARKQADEYREALKRTETSLKEAHFKLNNLMHSNNPLTQVEQQVIFDKCLQDKELQLIECRKQAEVYVQELMKTENLLKETREEFVKSLEMTQSKQKEMMENLSEIRTMLLMKKPENIPNCLLEIESSNKNDIEIFEDVFKDVKALIDYEIQPVKCNNYKMNTSDSDSGNSGSASLRVSQYEMHVLTMIATFLKVTPYPVSANCIYSYVAKIDNIVDLQFVETLLKKFPSFFKEVAVAPGSMEKNWIYLDLKPVITI